MAITVYKKETVDGLLADKANEADLEAVRTIALGKSNVYVYQDKASMESALTGSDKAKFKVGDSLFIIAQGVPDYWISGGSADDGWEVSELESKAQIDPALIADAKKAGTDAQAQVTALANGQVAQNKADIADLKSKVSSALGVYTIEGEISDGSTVTLSGAFPIVIVNSKAYRLDGANSYSRVDVSDAGVTKETISLAPVEGKSGQYTVAISDNSVNII